MPMLVERVHPRHRLSFGLKGILISAALGMDLNTGSPMPSHAIPIDASGKLTHDADHSGEGFVCHDCVALYIRARIAFEA